MYNGPIDKHTYYNSVCCTYFWKRTRCNKRTAPNHRKNELEEALLETRGCCAATCARVASCFVLMRSRIWTSELGAGKRGKKAKRTTKQHDSIFLCSGTMDIAIDCNVTRIISMWSDSSETFVKWHFSGDLCNTYIAGEMILFLSTVRRVSLFRK